jgi:hypothetical protein
MKNKKRLNFEFRVPRVYQVLFTSLVLDLISKLKNYAPVFGAHLRDEIEGSKTSRHPAARFFPLLNS